MTHGDTKKQLEECRNSLQIETVLSHTYCKTDGDKAEYLQMLFGLPRADYRETKRRMIALVS